MVEERILCSVSLSLIGAMELSSFIICPRASRWSKNKQKQKKKKKQQQKTKTKTKQQQQHISHNLDTLIS